MKRIGDDLVALMELLHTGAKREGNQAEHELGIELVNLARRSGITEDEIIDALCGRQS